MSFLALAGFALSAGSAILGHAGQNAQAKANAKNALDAYSLNMQDMGQRAIQATAAAAQEQDILGQQGAAARSTATASAAESGVAGASVDALLGDLQAQEAYASGTVQRNLDYTLGEINRRKQGAYVEYQGRLAGVPGANPFVTGLSLAGAGLKLASDLKVRP